MEVNKIYKVQGVYFTDQNEAGKFANEVGAMLVEVLTPNSFPEQVKEYNHAKELLGV